MANRLVTEFVGTFFLVLVIATAAVHGHGGDAAPLGVAAVLMAVIYGGGHISKAHYNPAISVAFLLRSRDFGPSAFAGYLAAQFIAAGVASGIALFFFPPAVAVVPSHLALLPALVGEFLFTFLLAWTIMNVATAKNLDGNPFYGVAIAMAVLAGIYSVGPISLALFNPAVAVSFVLLGKIALAQLWIPLLGSVTGSAAAVCVFRFGER